MSLERNGLGQERVGGALERARARRPSCGWWRGGRRWRTCRSRCRCRDPRSGSPGRWPASRTRRCRSGRCRRPGSALTGSRSPSPAIRRAVTRSHEVGGVVGDGERRSTVARDPSRHLHPVQLGEGAVDGREVPLDDRPAAVAVGLLHRFLDLGDRLVRRQHAGELEEAGLHHGVDAVAHAHVLGDARRRRSPSSAISLSMICCCTSRGRWSHTSSGPYGLLSRKVAPCLALVEHRHPLEQPELVAGDEVGVLDQVGRADRVGDRSAGATP